MLAAFGVVLVAKQTEMDAFDEPHLGRGALREAGKQAGAWGSECGSEPI